MSRITLLALASLATYGCARQPIRFERWGIAPLAATADDELYRRNRVLEQNLLSNHVSPEGLLQYRVTDLTSRVGYSGFADQACWGGYFLAAMSFRYWCEPTAEHLADVKTALAGLRLLHDATGVDGLIARSVVPVRLQHSLGLRLERWQPAASDPRYICRSDASRDQYSGYLFGLVAARTVVADAAVRSEAGALLKSVCAHLDRNRLRVHGRDGVVTRYGDLRERIFGLPIGVNAAIISAAYEGEWQRRSQSARSEWRRERLLGALQPMHFELFSIRVGSNDLMAAVGVLTAALANTNARYRARLREALRPFLPQFRGEGNAFFTSLAAVVGLRHSEDEICSKRNLLCAPLDQTVRSMRREAIEAVPRRWIPDRKGRRRTLEAMPLSERSPNSFIWKNSPFLIKRKSPLDGELRVSGVDLVVAYWLGRYSGWIAAPSTSTP